jgi:hypothetical protein
MVEGTGLPAVTCWSAEAMRGWCITQCDSAERSFLKTKE